MTNQQTTIDALAGGALHDGLPLTLASPLVIDRATRDRLVILDPTSAPFIRRVLDASDLRMWHAESSRFVIAIPRNWTNATLGRAADEASALEQLRARFKVLVRYLEPHADVLRAEPHGAYWWELPPYPVDWFAEPSIVWAHVAGDLLVAPSLNGAYLLTGISFTSAPSAYLLGLLGSANIRQKLVALGAPNAVAISQVAVAVADAATQQRVAELAERCVAAASEQATLEHEVLARVLRDLAPPGATAGSTLQEWWKVDFSGLLAELARRFRSDIPERYREEWQLWWAEQRQRHAALAVQLAHMQAEIDQLV